MDLVFKRYSSPFLLLDTLIQENQLLDFILELIEKVNDETIHELWLHKGYNMGYDEFKSKIRYKHNPIEKKSVETIIEDSMSVLDIFKGVQHGTI